MYNRQGGKEKRFFLKKKASMAKRDRGCWEMLRRLWESGTGAIQAFSCRDRLHDSSTGNRINEIPIKWDLEDFHLVKSIRM